jgi:tRNA A37 threonylcarbamoyladenosine dehydratase
VREVTKILVIGAGGLGCELLKDLVRTSLRKLQFDAPEQYKENFNVLSEDLLKDRRQRKAFT